MEFDSGVVSYEELLAVFWESHRPFSSSMNRQYKSAAWYVDAEQQRQATEDKQRLENENGQRVLTEILPATEFYAAEDYHQKYYLRHNQQLMRELTAYFGDDQTAFAASSVAARMNSYVAGYGDAASLERELADYGFSEAGVDFLRKLVTSREGLPLLCGGG